MQEVACLTKGVAASFLSFLNSSVILSGARQRGAEESREWMGTASGPRHSICPWGGRLDSSATLGMTGLSTHSRAPPLIPALPVMRVSSFIPVPYAYTPPGALSAAPMDARFRGHEGRGRTRRGLGARRKLGRGEGQARG